MECVTTSQYRITRVIMGRLDHQRTHITWPCMQWFNFWGGIWWWNEFSVNVLLTSFFFYSYMLNTNRINKLHYVAFHQKQSCFLSQLITSSNLIQEWHEIWEQWSFFIVLIWPRTTYSEILLINISSTTKTVLHNTCQNISLLWPL